MRNLILTILVLLCADAALAQLKVERSFEKARELSQNTGKPMAILITMQPPAHARAYFLKGLTHSCSPALSIRVFF